MLQLTLFRRIRVMNHFLVYSYHSIWRLLNIIINIFSIYCLIIIYCSIYILCGNTSGSEDHWKLILANRKVYFGSIFWCMMPLIDILYSPSLTLLLSYLFLFNKLQWLWLFLKIFGKLSTLRINDRFTWHLYAS